ncbi:MAG: sulfite exporter TauE/SafE family protein [Coriobacteriia bacterium]
MGAFLLAGLSGLVAGVISAALGLGGGILATPVQRLALGRPELSSVGTSLAVVLVAALVGGRKHASQGTARLRPALAMGAAGAPFAAFGAFTTGVVGGRAVVISLSVVLLLIASSALWEPRRGSGPSPPGKNCSTGARSVIACAGVGVIAGCASGFFGLGGGFVMVPALMHLLELRPAEASGTSLLAMPFLAAPGLLAHAVAGNVDWAIAAALSVGVVPGALLGAKVAKRAGSRTLRVAFAAVVVLAAVSMAAQELLLQSGV